MSQRSAIAARKRRRLITYAWVSGLAVVIFLLIYFEQTALLYILATLGVTALLVVVAAADLGGDNNLPTASATAKPAPADVMESAANSSRSRSSAARRR